MTTHPISADATDTETAVLNFDGITYGKGASVLKQLVATIGRDGFREGIRAYFRHYAWGTASLADFMAALEEGSGTDLGRWAALWLETPSINTIAAELTIAEGRIADLSVLQTAPAAFPTLRPHAMQLALVTERGGRLDIEAIAVKIDGPSMSVAEAKGRPAPVLVFPNHEDHDYARVLLGETSLAFARERLAELGDPLLRQLLWTSLWDMVRDARLRSTDFLEICRRILPNEPDLELVDAVLIRVGRCLADYVPGARRSESRAVAGSYGLAALHDRPHGDARIVWMRAAIMAAATPGRSRAPAGARGRTRGHRGLCGRPGDALEPRHEGGRVRRRGRGRARRRGARRGTARIAARGPSSRRPPRGRPPNPRPRPGAGSTPRATARTT